MDATLKFAQGIWNGRSAFDNRMEELARYIYPDRRGFTSKPTASDEGREDIFDSCPEEAAQMLAAALGSLLTNPASSFFTLELVGEEADAEAGEWLTDVSRLMLAAFSDPRSRFQDEIAAFYLDLPVFGWAVFLSEYHDGAGLRFKAEPPQSCAVLENAAGAVDTVVRKFSLTYSQMLELFGKNALPDAVKDAGKNNSQKPFPLLHLVCPRERLPEEKAAGVEGKMPFVSLVFEESSKALIRSGGYKESPYCVPRWSKRAGEVYGRGPGHAALPDIRVLNRVSEAQLIAAEKASNPPLLVPNDSVTGNVNTYAGGITYWQPVGGEITPMPVAVNLETMQVIRAERQEAIRRLFLNDRIMMAGGPQMTATEVMARERKQMLVLGPVLGRLQSEFLGPLVERVFGLLTTAGLLPEPPESLQGREIQVRYVSPIARAQKQGEAEAFSAALGYIAPLMQVQPDLMRNFDLDAVTRDTQDIFGYPQKYLRDEKAVQREREGQAKAAQEAAMAAMAQQQTAGVE